MVRGQPLLSTCFSGTYGAAAPTMRRTLRLMLQALQQLQAIEERRGEPPRAARTMRGEC